MKMKRLLSVALSATMAASVIGTALPAFALEDDGLDVKAYQTTSRYDMGLDVDDVRLGWEIDAEQRGMEQTAYYVVVKDQSGNTAWDSGWVESDQQVGIRPEGLKPETIYNYQVNIKDQYGNESGFSEIKTFETAPETIQGEWISSPRLLRKTFELDQPLENVDRARSYLSSSSVMEIRMNGSKVGDLVWGPKKPVGDVLTYYNTYDITSMLREGKNTVGIMVSAAYSPGNQAAGMIKIYYKDGSSQIISTDTSWKACATSEITRETISAGEDIDANLITNWDTPEFVEDETWTNATTAGLAASNGELRVPANSGTFTTYQSFSGDYSIELTATVQSNVCGFVFGSGTPNPCMWQLAEGSLRVHYPGDWSQVEVVPVEGLHLGQKATMRLDIQGNTITAFIDGKQVHQATVADGQTAGPLAIRSMPDEIVDYDRIAVTQNGKVIWEDNFDTVDREKWNFPSQAELAPAISGTKVIDEIKPVSMREVNYTDANSPYAIDGKLVLPTNCGTFTTKQSFSGDYTIELAAKTENVFGFLFGSGTPYPAMWQLATSGNGSLRVHQPGDWASNIDVINDCPGVDLNDFVPMKIEVKGNHITTYINDQKVHETDLVSGSTEGPLGFRATIDESSQIDYLRVIQDGNVIFEDNFDTTDPEKWNGFTNSTKKYILDFGKNMQGYVRLDTKGEKGKQYLLKYSELLDENGMIFANTTFHYPKSTYTLSGNQDRFEPRFFYTGFRYVEVSTSDGSEINPDDFTACFVSDDLDQTGFFDSSNDRLNQVFDMYLQSQRSNLIGNYTDCPQREKNGWTGDASVVKESSAILLNDYTSAEAFMETMMLNTHEDGRPEIIVGVPTTTNTGAQFDIPWSSAYFVFPYQLYMNTGDTYYIEKSYDSLVKVFDYYKSLDKDGDYIVTDNVYGDWLGYDNQEGKIDRGFLTAPYFYYCGILLSEMSEAIDKDHTELDAYLENMYQALQNTYNKETYFSTETQTANAMALDFEIVPPENKEAVVQTLVNAVTNANTTIKTGVLGTKSIYSALGEANQHKTLLDMTITPEKCSFGYMIDNGATTLWEYWDKAGETFNSNLTPGNAVWDSQNHAMMGGGPATWMFKGLGGITATGAGYDEITYRPGVESELEYVDTSIDTLKGLAESNWDIVDGDLVWDVTVPANSTATIKIPMKDAKTITESGNDIFQKDGNGITYVGQEENGDYVYTVGSGSYHFVASEQGSVVEESDKDILNKVITYAEEQKASDDFNNVIKDVQETFNAALDAAKEVAADPAATQDVVDAAWKALMTEIHKLGFVKGDIASLESLVVLAETYDMNDYVEAGQAEFKEALKAAQELLANKDNAMAEEIETAESNLLNAMLNLRYKADKSILEKVIAEANSKDASAYTEESYAALQAAVKDANDVMADENATQKEVDTAVTNVQTAMDQLVAVDGSIPEETTPSTNDTTTQTGQESTTPKANAAKTGDVAPIAGLIVLAAAGATAIGAKKRKK